MALFGGESKEEKQERKVQAILDKYGLQELSDPRDIASIKAIAQKLAGNNLITAGTAMAGMPQDVAKLTLLQSIVEQNWIIIRQLDKLNSK